MSGGKATAIVTASYAPDFERCRLLCQSIDQHVSNFTTHYILVETADVALFKELEGPRRRVVDERELLPSWLKVFPDPFSLSKRRIWLSFKTPPLRGWHTQQLRRIAIAKHAREDAFFYCDSDTVLVRDFDIAALWSDQKKLRLFRREHALKHHKAGDEQLIWAANAGMLLGTEPNMVPDHDYIGTLIAWRRDTMLDLCDHIEARSGQHWVAAMASKRQFSECMIYGQFADSPSQRDRHFVGNDEFCQMFWLAPMPPEKEFVRLVRAMPAHQVAIGIQSFLGADVQKIRDLIAAADI